MYNKRKHILDFLKWNFVLFCRKNVWDQNYFGSTGEGKENVTLIRCRLLTYNSVLPLPIANSCDCFIFHCLIFLSWVWKDLDGAFLERTPHWHHMIWNWQFESIGRNLPYMICPVSLCKCFYRMCIATENVLSLSTYSQHGTLYIRQRL